MNKILLDEFPAITLDNNIRICNFSSFHSYTFDTGEVLPSCTKAVADKYKLKDTHKHERNYALNGNSNKKVWWMDMSIKYQLTAEIRYSLALLHDINELDVVLVPFLLMDLLKSEGEYYMINSIHSTPPKIRTCKKVDPRDISQGIFSNKFCN
jgi:hypothetical protein